MSDITQCQNTFQLRDVDFYTYSNINQLFILNKKSEKCIGSL